MQAAGALLIVLGVAIGALSFGGGIISFGSGGPAGGFFILVGAIMATGGAVVSAIEDQTKALTAELRAQGQNYKAGVEALWKQLDAVRQNVAAPAAAPTAHERAIAAVPEPVSPPAPSMGFCPGCGKARGMTVPKCVYCGDMAPPRA